MLIEFRPKCKFGRGRDSVPFGYNPSVITMLLSAYNPVMPFPTARTALWALLVLALTGCATGGNSRDPLEPFNRGVFQVNDALDKAVLKPVAKGYKAVVPLPLRGGVDSFLNNLRDIPIAFNGLLQGKFRQAASDTGRFVINTSLGILGVFDVATRLGLERHDEDFGQTLGYWGLGSGPYLVLPFLGPSTIRDTSGLIVDYASGPGTYLFSNAPETWTVFGVRVLSQRANLLDAERLLDEAALDKYTFLRDAYLLRRERLIHGDAGPESSKGGSTRKTLKELEEELDEEPDTGASAGSSLPPASKPQ